MNPALDGRRALLIEQVGDDRFQGPLLALETCGKGASVALQWPDGRIVSADTAPAIGSARTLAPAIAAILKENSVVAQDLVAIAVTVGPGSFTGLRVGVAMAKTMAYALKIPTIAVDSLETLAWKAYQTLCLNDSDSQIDEPFYVWNVLDAYRGELFAALWKIHRSELDGSVSYEAIVPSHLVDCASWTRSCLDEARIPQKSLVSGDRRMLDRRNVALVGPGLFRCKEFLDADQLQRIRLHPEFGPHALMAAGIARQQLSRGQTTDPFQLMPVYLRGSAAEEKLSNRVKL